MLEISKEAAIRQGLDCYFTGYPCKYGHVSERYVRSGMCVQCARDRAAVRHQGGLRKSVWDKSNGKCWYCGTLLSFDRRKYQIDHIIPLKSGGTNDLANLVPTCDRCNNSKNNKTLEEFRMLRARQLSGRPLFSKEQILYLAEHGFQLPTLPEYNFWFEEHNL